MKRQFALPASTFRSIAFRNLSLKTLRIPNEFL